MIFKHFLRTSILFFALGLVVIGLASCKLPASTGPQTTDQTTEEFPVPGVSQTTNEIDIAAFATQTEQAKLPPVGPTNLPTQTPVPIIITPLVTNTPTKETPTSTPITYVTATPGGPPATYTLAEGEYPYCIARRFDVNLEELLTLNNLKLDSLLSPGDELKIPQTGNPFIGERMWHEHPTTYKIQEGDTLNRIACYFGDLSPDMIAAQNGLTVDAVLPVGETLIIP